MGRGFAVAMVVLLSSDKNVTSQVSSRRAAEVPINTSRLGGALTVALAGRIKKPPDEIDLTNNDKIMLIFPTDWSVV